METLMLPASIRREVALLAGAWQVSEGEAVGRLVDHFRATTIQPDRNTAAIPEQAIAVHATYQGQRVEGLFFPATKRLEVTSGQRAGRTYKSPSGAARAVITAINPHVTPNRDGWTFWIVAETGKLLQTLREV